MVKGFNFTPEYVLYEMSYANVVLYSATLPSYDSKGEKGEEKEKQETLNASDPANTQAVSQFLSSMKY